MLTNDEIQLHNCDCVQLMQQVPRESVDLVLLDPPWAYSDGGRSRARGIASSHYDCLDPETVAEHLNMAEKLAKPDTYAVVWCTFPKLKDWLRYGIFTTGYRYITGGAWGKVTGLGVGYHVRGDAELVLLYVKGSPKPRTTQSNLWVTEEDAALWLSRRTGHSEKPQVALCDILRMATDPGGLVLDLYAGESGSLMRACRATGRRYVGAEIDPERYEKALCEFARPEQADMFEAAQVAEVGALA